MMPPICAGRRDLSLDADADRGGPSSGGGAGLHQMFNGLLVGTSVKMLWAVLIVRQVDRRNVSTRIFVWAQTCMMGFCSREGKLPPFTASTPRDET
jgi:hypothetical protein